MCGSIARPRASDCSNGQTGTLARPVRRTDEHHRSHRSLGGVVVLAGVLEDLLHGAGRTRQEHDSRVADLQQDRLAQGVAEVLGDRGGEEVRRLVPVEPGRDPERGGVAEAGDRPRCGDPGVDRRVVRRCRQPGAPAPRPARPPARGRGVHLGWRPPSHPVHHRSRRCGCGRAEHPAGRLRRTPARLAPERARPSRRPGTVRSSTPSAPRPPHGRAAPVPVSHEATAVGGPSRGRARRGCRRRPARRTAPRRCRATSGSSSPAPRWCPPTARSPSARPAATAPAPCAPADSRGHPTPSRRKQAPETRRVGAKGRRNHAESSYDDSARSRDASRSPPCPRPRELGRGAVRTRGPSAPRTAPARRPRVPCRGTSRRCWRSRASGSPSRSGCRRGRRSGAGR